MSIKQATHSLEIREAPPFSFARDNRMDVKAAEEVCGISVLKSFSENSFYDTKVVLGEDYIKARMRLSDMYFVGYCTGTSGIDNTTWFTFSEASDSKKPHDPKFTDNSIKHKVDERDYHETFLKFTGQYTGGQSLMYTACKGGIDTNKVSKDLSHVVLDKIKIENAFHTLHKSYESDNIEKLYPQISWSCIIIAIIVSEAMRYEFVRRKIEDVWPNGYTLCADSIFYIKNWGAGSVLVLANKGLGDGEDIVAAKNDSEANTVLTYLKNKDIKKVGHLKQIFGLVKPKESSQTSDMNSNKDPGIKIGKGKDKKRK